MAAKTPCASVDKAAEHYGQVSWLSERALLKNARLIHSGATARDSHPLPYSLRHNGAPKMQMM